MSSKADKTKDEAGGLRYEGAPPQPNLLDYREMNITMGKWANTDTGWRSMIALVVFAFGMVFVCSILLNSMSG